MVIKSMYKWGELTMKELVGNLQVFKFHHLLLRQNQIVVGKGKSIVLKTTKGSGSNKKARTTLLIDKYSSHDEETMMLLAKILLDSFKKRSPLLVESKEIVRVLSG